MNRSARRRAERGARARRPTTPASDLLSQATAAYRAGRFDAAERACREVLEGDPVEARALLLLGAVLRATGRLDEAVATARRAAMAGASAEAHTELGLALRAQDRLVEALGSFRRAVEADTRHGRARLALGATLLELDELDEALDQLHEAQRLDPDEPAAPSNLGFVLQRMGRFRDAVGQFDEAVALSRDDPTLRYNRAFALLGSGDLAAGWDDYDLGFAAGDRTPDRHVDASRWDGAPAPDATLLVWREQGVGDELRFASCYADAADRVGKLLVECDPRLVPLLTRSFPNATVRPESADTHATDVDLHCPAGSLPRVLRRSLEAFPVEGGYLRADSEAVTRWRTRLGELGRGAKVGLCWRSGHLTSSRLANYTVLDEWAPLLTLPDVEVVSLQYGPERHVEAEIAAVRERTGAVVHRWSDLDHTDDFDELAALTTALDAVVGVNTTPLMLAGALGVPVHMLSRPHPLAFGTGRFPWMPSLRLHVRSWDEPWERPIAEVAAAVRALASGR